MAHPAQSPLEAFLRLTASAMSERNAFGPNLRRIRIQHGISLDAIAVATKISPDLLAGLERNDFSRWPSGIYARAYVRAYAAEIGADPDAVVDDFCRWFPQGDRRAERVVREQAALVGHTLDWKDDLIGLVVERDRRAKRPTTDDDLPALAVSRTGRMVAAVADCLVTVALAMAVAAIFSIGKVAALAVCAMLYHGVTLAALGSTPAVWLIETYLVNRHPSAAAPARSQRFLRLVRSSEQQRAKI